MEQHQTKDFQLMQSAKSEPGYLILDPTIPAGANDALENQSNEWKEFLSNSHSSTGNAEIHSTDPVHEITISEATQRHNNNTEQLVTDCKDNGNDDGVKLKKELQVSVMLCYKNQTENVEKIMTFASEEGIKDSEFLSFPTMFTCKNEKKILQRGI